MYLKRSIFLFIFLIASLTLFSQTIQLSTQSKISVLTIAPGKLVNDAFGHSAIRIKDSENGLDLIFNYGIYDFNAPNFYLNFAKGKLNFSMGVNSYSNFLTNYINQGRTVREQILNLDDLQKQTVFSFLAHNSKPENRGYLYDFFYDNCATKMRDVLQTSLDSTIVFLPPKDFETKTFRNLIQEHLHSNSWGSLGIDLALGSVIDKKALPEEHMFLPNYVFRFFNHAHFLNTNKPLVNINKILYKGSNQNTKTLFILSPLFMLIIISLFVIGITYFDFKKNKRSKWLDGFIFGVTGFIGLIILLLWFATNHTATSYNYNLLWAFVINLFLIGYIIKDKPKLWLRKYIKFLIIMMVLLTIHWLIGVQVFAVTLIPLLIALLLRYLFLVSFLREKA